MEYWPNLIALVTFFICVDQFWKASAILYVITMRAWSQLSSTVSPCEIGAFGSWHALGSREVDLHAAFSIRLPTHHQPHSDPPLHPYPRQVSTTRIARSRRRGTEHTAGCALVLGVRVVHSAAFKRQYVGQWPRA